MAGRILRNIVIIVVILLSFYNLGVVTYGYYSYSKEDVGTLSGDVQNWAMLIQNYILQLANDGIKREFTQSLFDSAEYTFEEKNGDKLVEQVKKSLGEYFLKKKTAAKKLADKVVELYDKMISTNWTSNCSKLFDLKNTVYRDSDIPARLPDKMEFSPYFKQPVSFLSSSIKISDEVPRDDIETIDTVAWSAQLDSVFLENSKNDPQLRWQYFGSTAGLARIYPGREWNTNFAGFYDDYDPRLRPWYIAATSGPKDVIVILDCSHSMRWKEKFRIAQAVAKAVIDTLTRMDYVNVICARASYWDGRGTWHEFNTEVLSCQSEHMVQATLAHKKDLIEKIHKLEPGGTSELEKGFEMAFSLLGGRMRTGCQSLIVLVTDGLDNDGEDVRCGPGHYSRSGYVSGPICLYNWTKVWDIVDSNVEHQKSLNKTFDVDTLLRNDYRASTTDEGKCKAETNCSSHKRHHWVEHPTRIFSYLTVEDAELFPGRVACKHRGSFKKLHTGVNLISQMSNYFHFLSGNSENSEGLWTSPYIDAWGLSLIITRAIPCISKFNKKLIGVVGVDATLEEIESSLNRHQWGSVYSFLMNAEGETIFHPRLKPSENLVTDPIFIPIQQLEQDKDGNPKEFSQIVKDMKNGKTGSIIIPKARLGRKGEYIQATYYYATLEDSGFAFAFSLSDTDKIFRRAQEPKNKSVYNTSYFNLLIEYNSTIGRKELPGVFEYLDVKENENRFTGLRVSYGHSSIFLSPKCHCDQNAYFYDDDLARKTVDAHQYINAHSEDDGCDNFGKYVKGLRADVFISQPVENLWRTRSFDGIDDVKWTYVAMRSGVFRTYPAHRSRRNYDPTSRDWFLRAKNAPSKTAISTAYMDSAGVGKIITLSRALFEGMMERTTEECKNISKTGPPWPGGCGCHKDEECLSGQCYLSVAKGPNRDRPRCATERVEAVTSLDILYKRFHEITMLTMKASDDKKSCGQRYNCSDGEPGCETRCYLFDNQANMITDPDFLMANDLDERKYKGVTMGKKEGEIMKDLIYTHGFFVRTESIDFQDVCSISPYAPKVTLDGIPQNPEELDNYFKNKGPIPKFKNEYGCITDVVKYVVKESALGPSGMITGNVSGPCMSGFYYVTALPKTNLFLLVIENWKHYKDTFFFNFNCKIAQSIVNSGAYRIINGTCAHTDSTTSTLSEMGMCPALRNVDIPCEYNSEPASFRVRDTNFYFFFAFALKFLF